MSWLSWIAAIGALLLVFTISSAYVQRGPISTSALYLLIGIALGPVGFDVVDFNVAADADVITHITEVAVVVALFMGGLRLRLSLRDRAWRAAFLLAGPVMILSIMAVAAVAHVVLDLPLAGALLLAAILAPTDPVLASAVAVEDAADQDHVRYGLSGEAGLNDGTAFPFVVLALAWAEHGSAGAWLLRWALTDLLWAIPAALVLGYACGTLVGRFAIHLRSHKRDDSAPNDFLALALIALAYVGAETIGAWGFLAVFAAGVGLRAAEVRVVMSAPHPEIANDPAVANEDHPPAEHLVGAHMPPEALEEPAVAAGMVVSEVLSFGDTLERIVEIALVIAVGVAVVPHWDARALPIAGALFFVIRPLITVVVLRVTRTTNMQRWLIGWFGVRGIGSLFYLGYALTHGAHANRHELIDITISVVAASVVLHGITAKPLLAWYGRRLRAPKSA